MNDAKEIFTRYGGNHGLMHQDGVYADYPKNGVSRHQEAEWAKELEKDLLKKVRQSPYAGRDFFGFVNLIRTFKSSEALLSLVNVAASWRSHADTFTMLLAAELISETYLSYCDSGVIQKEEMSKVSAELQGIVSDLQRENSFTICDAYRQDGMFLPGTFSDESIRKRINRLIS